ncbi:MAG TPA: hypothetical protein VLB50_14410, partial [Ignavibacteriaceae bacterium]|nr:hypothetical protein [Ignavibacteriaceae bacterium]
MNKITLLILLSVILTISYTGYIKAQEEEPVRYFQMEPLDDSLFVHIQNELNIDPPDPKAEIIVDLRDVNNQTISIKGNLYPFLALTAETRAKVVTYPFKINLEETINYGSVFTRIFEKIRFNKIVNPPSKLQISPSLAYINPFFQFFGGERFGIPFKSDLGISFGFGTKYSGPGESNYVEANFHILGLTGGVFGPVEALSKLRENKSNNLYATAGFHIFYVIPFGNFFEFGYSRVLLDPTDSQFKTWKGDDTLNTHVKILGGSYFNFEIRYPISFFGSTRGKIYGGRYLNEWHIGYTGRELSLAGSTFDLRFDAMFNSDVRRDQYLLETLV